jgi:RNA polymerase sigma-70 factor (ECF subfamily)
LHLSGQFEESPAHALERWMAEYGDELLRLCFMMLSDRALAEDALQESFLKAFQAHAQFKGDSSEKTWLTRIAVNCCHDMRRKSWWKRIDWDTELASIPDTTDPYSQADDTVAREVLRLSPKYRDPVLLFYFLNFDTREVAQILGIPQSTALTRLRRARALLRDALKEWLADEE